MSAHTDTDFRNILPEYSITSLRQVVSVYGRLNYLSRGVSNFDGYQPYYTPGKVDESMSVVVAEIDLTGESTSVGDVWVRGLSEGEATGRLGYSWYYASRGHDYSFTHRTSSSSASTIANWLAAGLSSWAPPDETPEYEQAVLDDHPDGWVVEQLAATGDETISQLKEAVEEEAPTSGGNKLLTARFRLPSDQITRVAESADSDATALRAYPGELDICNAVMKAARTAGYTTMSSIEGKSEGRGADMNSGREGNLVGFATDHLKHYTTKQRERFDGFDAHRAWQVHPVSDREALYLDAAEDYLDACYSSFGQFRVYHLPYFRGSMTPPQGRALYDFLERLVDERDNESDQRASALSHFRDFADEYDNPELEDVRFWTVFQNYDQKDRRDVFREAPALRVQPSERLARSHIRILDSVFGDGGLPYSGSDYALSQPDQDESAVASTIESGWYFTRTFPEYTSGADDDLSPATDDPRPQITANLLAGGTVETEQLLSEYLEKLAEEYDGDGRGILFRLAEQASQLKALAAAEMLEPTDETQQSLTKPPDMTGNTPSDDHDSTSPEDVILGSGEDTDDTEPEATTAETARQYIERTPALSESDDRAAAFLLGYTTGMMSRYQAGAEEMTRTFADQFPAHNLTTTGAKRLYTELQGKAVAYADGAGSVYKDLIAELTDASPRTPDEWNLSLVDIRFHYGEGVALALNAD